MSTHVTDHNRNTNTRRNSAFLPSLNANWKHLLGPSRDSDAHTLRYGHGGGINDTEDVRSAKARRREAAIISSSSAFNTLLPFTDVDTNASTSAARPRSNSQSSSTLPVNKPPSRHPSSGSSHASSDKWANRLSHLKSNLHPSLALQSRTALASPREIANSFLASQHIKNAVEEERCSANVVVSEAAGEAAKRELERMGVRRRSGPRTEAMSREKGKEKENFRPRREEEGSCDERDRKASQSSVRSALDGGLEYGDAETTLRGRRRTASMSSVYAPAQTGTNSYLDFGPGPHPPRPDCPARVQVRPRTRTLSSAHTGPPISPSGLIVIKNARGQSYGHGYAGPRQRTPSSSSNTQDGLSSVPSNTVVGGRHRSDTTSTMYSMNSMITYQSTSALLRRGSEDRYTPSTSSTPTTLKMTSSSSNVLGRVSGASRHLSMDVAGRTPSSKTLMRHSSEASQERALPFDHEGGTSESNSGTASFANDHRPSNVSASADDSVHRPFSIRRIKPNSAVEARTPTDKKPLKRRLVLVWKKVSSATRSVMRAVRRLKQRGGMRRTGEDSRGHIKKSRRSNGRSRARARATARKDGISLPRPQTVASTGSNASSLPVGFELVDPSNPASSVSNQQEGQRDSKRWSKRFSAPRFRRRSNGVIEMENYPGTFRPVPEGQRSWRSLRKTLREKLDREKGERERRRLMGEESPLASPTDSPVRSTYL